jgi:hypothetical protein
VEKRSFAFKRKGQRRDPDKMPSFGTRPLSGSDDAASQGRQDQDNDFEAPLATQSAVLFPFPEGYGSCRHVQQPSVSHDAISAELDDRLAARTEFQCKGILC